MGQSESSFKRTYDETVAELSSLQLQEITSRFSELYAQAGGSKGHVVDREAFAKYFKLPPTVGDRLFDAFDEKQNGKISFEEFVCGLAIVLHGSFHDRCALLFRVFNLAGDEGVSREELTTMLAAILQSTDTILYTVCESGGAVLGSEGRVEAVRIMVDEAFKNCDITGTGKLLPVEFEYWMKRNPKVLDSLLSFSTQENECTLGQLIMSPSEQRIGGVAPQEGSRSELASVNVLRNYGVDSTDQEERAVIFEVHSDAALQDSSPTDDIITESTMVDDIITDSDSIVIDHTHSDNVSINASITDDSVSTQLSDLPHTSSLISGHAPNTNISTVTKPPTLVSEPYPGEGDQLACAWIPGVLSHETVTSDHLTCPALVADIAMTDPIGELLSQHFPESQRRPLLSVDSVSMDVGGLRKLVSAGCFHSALDLTSRFLSAHGQGAGQSGQPTLHTHKTLQMWSSRLTLLTYLGLYKEAESELEEFGELDNPDLYYQHHTHSYPGRKGSLVPFSMRLVHAIVPSLASRTQLTLDRLCFLKSNCSKILEELDSGRLPGVSSPLSAEDVEVARELWTGRLVRVLYFLGNTLVSLSDYHLATRVYQQISELCPQDTAHINAGLGRLYLTLGDLLTARDYFSKVEKSCGGNNSIIHMNRALVSIFQSRWQAARDCLQMALSFDPSNLVIKSNLTVSTFYQGRLKEAIENMEQLISEAPPASLQPALFANLAAAYELESGRSLGKKLYFVPLLGAHVCEGFQIQSLNIR